jgi:hypothetical protein
MTTVASQAREGYDISAVPGNNYRQVGLETLLSSQQRMSMAPGSSSAHAPLRQVSSGAGPRHLDRFLDSFDSFESPVDVVPWSSPTKG